MRFQPILEDLPLAKVKENINFRNSAREQVWGKPVFFFPPNYSIDQLGCGGYHYVYGQPYREEQGYEGNCTYWVGCRYYDLSHKLLTEVIGRAVDTYPKYNGRKDGGNVNGQYIGDTINQGDMLVFADNKSIEGDGHIVFVEYVDDKIHVSESGYSKNQVYHNKACVTYTLEKSDMVTGKSILLRPQAPYRELLYGVIHTGDVFEDFDLPKKVERDKNKDQLYVEDISLNCRKEPSTKSLIYGAIGEGYYNVEEIKVGDDYTWYYLGNCWVAGVKETKYYPATNEIDYKKLYKELSEKIEKIKDIINE